MSAHATVLATRTASSDAPRERGRADPTGGTCVGPLRGRPLRVLWCPNPVFVRVVVDYEAGSRTLGRQMMKFIANTVTALLAVIALGGCAQTGHLYPANAEASATGVLEAHYKAYGTGHGELTIAMPDGEVLNGEYTIVRQGAIGFGSIIASVSGPGGSAYGSGFASGYAMEGGSPGMASVYGTKGTSMQCEFYNDNWSGHGYGGCRSSTGALYRLQY